MPQPTSWRDLREEENMTTNLLRKKKDKNRGLSVRTLPRELEEEDQHPSVKRKVLRINLRTYLQKVFQFDKAFSRPQGI